MTLRLLVRATLGQKFCLSLEYEAIINFWRYGGRDHFVMFAQELVVK